MTVMPQLSLNSLLKSACYGAVLFCMYQGALTWLVTKDWSREDYSSSALIPLVVLYLLWEKRGRLAGQPSRPSWAGLAPLLAGIMLFWLGELSGEFFALYFSLWLVVTGLCWLHLGWDKLKIIAFPLCFSLTMFPLPHFVNTQLSLKLKLISSQLGVAFLHLSGMSVFREGNVIDVGFTRLQVVDACSGIRYMMPLLTMAILLASYYKAALWKRLLLVLSSLPVAVVTNGMRIASVGLLYPVFGPEVAEGFFHDFSGWLIFMFSLALLLAEIWLLKRIAPETAPGTAAAPVAPPQSGASGSSHAVLPLLSRFFVAALILLTTSLVAAKSLDIREITPLSRPLSGFPVVLGEWSGIPATMEQIYRDALSFSDYTIIDYHNQRGETVNFYTAYYSSQTKGESIHSPATCLPGSGWNFVDASVISLPLGAGSRSMRVNRAFIEKDGQRQLTYYWFPQRGRVLTNAVELKLYAGWDALTTRRTDGALVRLITPLRPGERLPDAEARMQSFAQLLVPALDRYLPGKSDR